MVITLANRKGGTGKTTSAAYIAQCLHQAGQNVLGLDLDDEQSWKKWWDTGALPYPVRVLGKKDDIGSHLDAHDGPVVIDTPPNDGEVIYKVSIRSDEVIIPLSATSLDLNRLISTLQTVEEIEKMRRKPLASILFTRWQGQHVLSQDAAAALGKRNAPLLDTRVRQLTRYAGFGTPSYLDEYEAVLSELGVVRAQA